MAKYCSFHPITLRQVGFINTECSEAEIIPDDYIEVSDEILETFNKNPEWVWDGEKPVPPSEAPPLTKLQFEMVRELVEKSSKLKKQAEEIYIEYGKFVVMFEHLCEQLRSCIKDIFEFNINTELIGILINDYKIQDYTNKILALHNMIYPEDDSKLIVKKLMDKIITLNTNRNNVVHGLWFIGHASSDQLDFDKAWYKKTKLQKGNLNTTSEEMTAKKLQLLFKEAAKLHGLVGRLGYCLSKPSPGKVLRNITEDMIETGEGFRSIYHPIAPIWDISMADKYLKYLNPI